MHSDAVMFRISRRRRRNDKGAVAIIVALALTAVLIGAAMVLDFGLVRVDRQVDQSAADAADSAGLYALGTGGTDTHPYLGVCAALRYLQQNNSRFSGVTHTSGTWTDGTGTPAPDGCTDSTAQQQVCQPGDTASWAVFKWSGTWQGEPIEVTIQSGYHLAGSGWEEESLPAAQTDENDTAQGCDQLAVIITQHRKPGLGSLATSSDLVSAIRSVGRVVAAPGGDVPAMLLLDQHGCQVLSSTSGGGGSNAYIHVYGAYSPTTGKTQPGSIHADTDASQCSLSSHPYVFYGSAADTIVAYAAPMSASSTSPPDPAKPGRITSVAGLSGVSLSTIEDSSANVYGSAALNESGAGAAAKDPPTGRELVTRKPVDDRYLGLGASASGVTGAINAAWSSYFSQPATLTTANGWTVINSCSASASDLSAVSISSKVYVNCTANSGYTGTAPIVAQTVVFAGSIKPPNSGGSSVSLPNATQVYVFGAAGKDAISLGNGGVFSMHTVAADGNTNLNGSGQCTTDQRSNDKATLIVKAGDIKGTGGLLQLCRTTVLMMGGQSDGCLPTVSGTAPTSTPCGGGTGDGQITLSGGSGVDWTAPNAMAATTDSDGNPTDSAIAAWSDTHGPEDLALWSESAGLSNTPTFSMSGSGVLHTVGVFMVPNAAPFTIGGGGVQNLTNAQYVAADIALNGGAELSMKVDPDAGIALPTLKVVGLVR